MKVDIGALTLSDELTISAPEGGTFSDVLEYQLYTEAVEWAAANDIVNGYGDSSSPLVPWIP